MTKLAPLVAWGVLATLTPAIAENASTGHVGVTVVAVESPEMVPTPKVYWETTEEYRKRWEKIRSGGEPGKIPRRVEGHETIVNKND